MISWPNKRAPELNINRLNTPDKEDIFRLHKITKPTKIFTKDIWTAIYFFNERKKWKIYHAIT